MIDLRKAKVVTFRGMSHELWPKVSQLRFQVFIIEQEVPDDEEFDQYDTDSHTTHVACVYEDEVIGTGRLYWDTKVKAGRIGRMAVDRLLRKGGVGKVIMRALIQEAQERGWRDLVLSAQTHAIPFYERLGFAAEGSEYLDAGIPHRTMRRRIG